ncbi:MAG: peptide chain release factor N(5)-glutamine methyltransferase [Kiritimatiellae bacterium]|nr:peptide chain release factor N(5)-glutamine methyltransferase [Kiritimatiellia bacterium]MDW8458791.1 peptide chain release factor N(5)-glutamine methyltransferase [Verrucomicrobiota bacterium]
MSFVENLGANNRPPAIGPTLQAAVRQIEAALARAGIEDARAAADWLVAETAGIGRLDLYVSGDRPIPAEWIPLLVERARRVEAGEPLQYVLGYAPFMGRDFLCDRRALIPRPETEELCERVLDALPREFAGRVADVGTGTGCLAITIVLDRPDARVEAIDISKESLELARENARRFGVDSRIQWILGDLLAGAPEAAYDVIVSNPPYVSEAEWSRLPLSIREYEPPVALIGGADGLAVIRRLAAQSRSALKPGGMLWLEMGNDQGQAVRRLLEDLGFVGITVYRDAAGHERIAAAMRPHV